LIETDYTDYKEGEPQNGSPFSETVKKLVF